jgi:hypothetical protein
MYERRHYVLPIIEPASVSLACQQGRTPLLPAKMHASMITPETWTRRPVLTCETIAFEFETDMISGQLLLKEEEADRDCPNTEAAAELSVQQSSAEGSQSPGPTIRNPSSAVSPARLGCIPTSMVR